MNLDRYEKFLRMAQAPSAAPNERNIAAQKLAKMEAEHPDIRRAFLQRQAARAAMYRAKQAAGMPSGPGTPNFDTLNEQLAFAAQRALEWGLDAAWQKATDFFNKPPGPLWTPKEIDMPISNDEDIEADLGRLDWANVPVADVISIDMQLLEGEDPNVGDILGGELEMPMGFIAAAVEDPDLAVAFFTYLLEGDPEEADAG